MLEYLAGLRKIFDEDAMTGPTTKSIAERLTYLFDSSAAGASPAGGSIAAILRALAIGTTSAPVVAPSLAAHVSATSGSSVNTYGAWVQVVAAGVWTAHMLTHIYAGFNGTANAGYFQIQVGTGGAGSEVGIGEYIYVTNINANTTLPYLQGLLCWPPLFIPASARVAVRIASDGISQGLNLKLGACPRPIG